MSDPFLEQASGPDLVPPPLQPRDTSGDTGGNVSHLANANVTALKPVEPGASRVPPLSSGGKSNTSMVARPSDPSSAFLMADPQEAPDYAVLLVIRGHGPVGSVGEFAPGDRITLRNEVVGWVDVIKGRGVGDLMSATARDNSVGALVDHLLHEMVQSRSQVWSTTLPTGRQIIGAPERLVDAVGKDRIIQVVHRRALELARHAGDLHNQQALASYEFEGDGQQRGGLH